MNHLKLFNLSFERLKEIITNLNLSQELFSKILGWSKKVLLDMKIMILFLKENI